MDFEKTDMKKSNIVHGASLSEAPHNEFSDMKQCKTWIKDVHTNIYTGEKTVINEGDCNLLVNGFSEIVAGLLKNEPGFVGIQFWAVGQGEWTGDPQTSPWDVLSVQDRQAKSEVTMTSLFDEIARVSVSMNFLDAGNNITASITNKIEIVAIFDQTVSGYLREFGLFGGNGTIALGSGIMLDHKAHSVISHNIGSATMTLTRTLRLTL